MIALWRTMRLDAAVLSLGYLIHGVRGALISLVAAEALRLAARLIP